ncbi:MAG: 3-phosphoshikimate 1-carboxyvinyltransferase [Candidatus Gastranaerophilales bacterium]|nr:3-phosphoshikimate 1-carboxyvinyltransferase [Candidatus Gastranaerophilales bacterium]
MDVTLEKSLPLKGEIEIPADKSITHRAFMFSALAKGVSRIKNYSLGADCMSTLEIIKQLGCEVDFTDTGILTVNAKNALTAPKSSLNCGNSGTTTRLIAGILAGQKFNSKLYGDESLSKRPMKRVITPLELMGAKLIHNDYKLPIEINGSSLHGINYNSALSSAQVKSCILLAGLNAEGETIYTEPYKSRNHTELMLEYMGADLKVNKNSVVIKKSELSPIDITIPGDISSAAFFMAAALIVPDSDIVLKNVGINETRSGIIDVIKAMNGDIELINERLVSNEKTADIRIKYSDLKALTIEGEIIPRLIDELPVITVIASQAKGTTIIKNAGDLRNKEADRITAVTKEMKKLGADIEETSDGFIINGKQSLKGGCEIECYHDHRIAMSAYISGLICESPIKINNFQWVDISFPEFLTIIKKLTVL